MPKSKCIHHWIIESPSGPTSRGVCKKCNKKRSFNTSHEHDQWNNQPGFRRKNITYAVLYEKPEVKMSDEV